MPVTSATTLASVTIVSLETSIIITITTLIRVAIAAVSTTFAAIDSWAAVGAIVAVRVMLFDSFIVVIATKVAESTSAGTAPETTVRIVPRTELAFAIADTVIAVLFNVPTIASFAIQMPMFMLFNPLVIIIIIVVVTRAVAPIAAYIQGL